MQLKMFSVAAASLAMSAQALTLPKQQDDSALAVAMPPNLLAESYAEDIDSDFDEDYQDFGLAQSYADDDLDDEMFLGQIDAEDKYDHSDFYAQAYASAFGDEEAEQMLAEQAEQMLAQAQEGFLGNIGDQAISSVDACQVFDSAWECVSSPQGCIYRDTAHECTKL